MRKKISSNFLSQPVNQSTRKRFLFSLKLFILLSPIPFGCVGKIWNPLFYAVLTLLTFWGIRVVENQKVIVEAEIGDRSSRVGDGISTQNSKFKTQNFNDILYGKWIKRLFMAFLIFIGFQCIPLPIALVNILSPNKIEVLGKLIDELPAFTSLSWVPFNTLIYGLVTFLYGLFFLLLFQIRMRKREMVSLLNVLVLSASVQVVFGLLKLAQGNTRFFLFFFPVEKSDISRFLTGTLGNSNHFAFYLEMIISLALALFFFRFRFFQADVSWKQKILSITDENKILLVYFIAINLMGVGILLTGTRAGIVTMLFVFILFSQLLIYLKLSRRVRRKMIWILAAISVFVLFVGVQNTLNEFKRSPMAEGGRLTRWPNTLDMVQDFPVLGTGMGTYKYTYFLYDTGPGKWSTHAHNDILEILAEGGIMGSILLYSLMVLIILSILKKWLQRHHPDVRILGVGILVSIVAVLFHSFFDFSLRIPSNMLVFVLILSLGLKIVNYKRRDTVS